MRQDDWAEFISASLITCSVFFTISVISKTSAWMNKNDAGERIYPIEQDVTHRNRRFPCLLQNRIPGGKKRLADRQKCFSIRTAACEHTEPVGEIRFGMVVKESQEFDLPEAGAMTAGLIKDEAIDPISTCEGNDRVLDDGGSEHRRESVPTYRAGTYEALGSSLLI